MGLDVLYLLIPASTLLALIAFALFWWAIRNGQFDDLETPAVRAVMDDRPVAAGAAAQRAASDSEPRPPLE